jgi:polyisoprenoid-binding protein YceI
MSVSNWNIDTAHTDILFSVRHMGISTVRGKFTGVTGTAVADPADASTLHLDVKIDPSTISTGDEKRDAHLRSSDFFDAEKFPAASFKSTGVTKDGDEYKLTGDFTLHGVTKSITLDVESVSSEAKDPWGGTRIGASAHGMIHRKDFGITFNAPLEAGGFMIGDDVKLTIDAQFVKQA